LENCIGRCVPDLGPPWTTVSRIIAAIQVPRRTVGRALSVCIWRCDPRYIYHCRHHRHQHAPQTTASLHNVVSGGGLPPPHPTLTFNPHPHPKPQTRYGVDGTSGVVNVYCKGRWEIGHSIRSFITHMSMAPRTIFCATETWHLWCCTISDSKIEGRTQVVVMQCWCPQGSLCF
jgi:hypothetical protein